jgi:hypothetical protein
MNSQNLYPSQIVYLEHEQQELYGEVIQLTEENRLCWVRPFLLTIKNEISTEETTIIDLRFTADLILPENFFQPALDVDFINLFVQLDSEEYEEDEKLSYAYKQLNLFINKLLLAKIEAAKNVSYKK